jgi:hypothetical protein
MTSPGTISAGGDGAGMGREASAARCVSIGREAARAEAPVATTESDPVIVPVVDVGVGWVGVDWHAASTSEAAWRVARARTRTIGRRGLIHQHGARLAGL